MSANHREVLMQLGMVGLGRMGGAMRRRLERGGHEVVGFDPASPDSDVGSLDELVARLEPPRTVWSMVPAGEATASTLATLLEGLSPGDRVVEGGNSPYWDSVERAAGFAARGIGFVDAGVSGGVWGEERGYALMVGGSAEDVAAVRPLLETLAPAGDGPGLAHVGPPGAGHFTKMVHNGIEYAVMQAFGEGVELLQRHPLDVDLPATLNAWQEGSVISSWLLDLLVEAYRAHPGLADVEPYASDSGEGRWMLKTAVEHGVPTPALAAALFARFESQQPSSTTYRVLAALREQFGGHALGRDAATDDAE